MPENHAPLRIVSLQPSVTVTLRDLGALDRLVACTKYCIDICPEARETGCLIVEDSWSAKAEQIMAAKPDLVIASVPYRLESVAEIIKCGVPFLGLAPRTLDDIYKDIMMMSQMLGLESWRAPRPGGALIAKMEKEVQAMWQKTMGMTRPLVYCEEWGKPLILSQPWVAELVEAAGGRFFGQPGKHTTEEEVAAADPEVIIAAWCGAGDRVPLDKVAARSGWEKTRAVKGGRVYCINDEFLNTPASTLMSGLRALAAAVHPEIFGDVTGLRRIQNTIVLK
ncbi:MAG TPA: ABC transporter substrate-binding protein [Candidatus Angelobacter sp.]|nr:ABC transporter substrate-binding protein [Candidatus Angelobacter sp.]